MTMSRLFSHGGHHITFDESTLDNLVPKTGTPKRWNAPLWLKKHVTRHMYLGKYFKAKHIICSDATLEEFYSMYGLLEDSKDPRAKKLFKTTIDREAKEITQKFESQHGISGEKLNEGTPSYYIISPHCVRGYEHILDDSWDGVLTKKFVEMPEIKGSLSHGLDRGLYTPAELDEMTKLIVEAKNKLPSMKMLSEASRSATSPLVAPQRKLSIAAKSLPKGTSMPDSGNDHLASAPPDTGAPGVSHSTFPSSNKIGASGILTGTLSDPAGSDGKFDGTMGPVSSPSGPVVENPETLGKTVVMPSTSAPDVTMTLTQTLAADGHPSGTHGSELSLHQPFGVLSSTVDEVQSSLLSTGGVSPHETSEKHPEDKLDGEGSQVTINSKDTRYAGQKRPASTKQESAIGKRTKTNQEGRAARHA